jgi:ABC-type transport system involved in cytochrome c biogenesis permease subunit
MQYLAFFLLNSDPTAAIVAMMAIIPIIILVCLLIILIPFWFILKKAGFSPWLTLINILPLGTLILLYVLAFAEWKVVPAPQPVWQQPPYPPQA